MSTVSALVRVSITVKGHYDQGSSYKGKHFDWLSYNFRGSMHYHFGGTWGNADRYYAVAESPTF